MITQHYLSLHVIFESNVRRSMNNKIHVAYCLRGFTLVELDAWSYVINAPSQEIIHMRPELNGGYVNSSIVDEGAVEKQIPRSRLISPKPRGNDSGY